MHFTPFSKQLHQHFSLKCRSTFFFKMFQHFLEFFSSFSASSSLDPATGGGGGRSTADGMGHSGASRGAAAGRPPVPLLSPDESAAGHSRAEGADSGGLGGARVPATAAQAREAEQQWEGG